MESILDSAQTWFFDSCTHDLSGVLIVRLVEGIKGAESEFVDIEGTKLGPCFPVRVLAQSRCAQVVFPDVPLFFVYNESYQCEDPELKMTLGHFLSLVEGSSFRKFAESATSVADLHQGGYQEFLLSCEDRLFHVFSSETPQVTFLEESPDLEIERTSTWVVK